MATAISMEKTDHVNNLLSGLSDKNGVIRKEARTALVQLGGPDVTRALVSLLVDLRKQVRWEAAKALVELKDPVTAPALLNALEDDDADIRWIAAEGLTALGELGLLTVLDGLKNRAKSSEFCSSAHHVLNDFKRSDYEKVIRPVLEALQHPSPAVAVPRVAFDALLALAPQRCPPLNGSSSL